MRDEFRLDAVPDDDPTATMLRTVLHREADAVQPSLDGLSRIRAEIARQAPGPGTRLLRRSAPLLAAAAVVLVLAGAGGLVVRWRGQTRDGAPVASGALVATMDQNEARSTPAATVPVYVTGRQGGRTVLFREFRATTADDEEHMVADAVRLAVTTKPLDPRYTTLFAAAGDTTVTAHVTGAQIKVDISPAPQPAPGVSKADAVIAAQQIVWTATAAASVAESGAGPTRGRDAGYKQPGLRPVSVTLEGRRGATLFGMSQLDRDPNPGMVRYAYLKGYQDPRADVWIGDVTHGQHFDRGHQQITGDAVSRADGVVHLVLYRNSRRIFATQLGLGTSEESGFTAAPKPGERGHWSIDLDLAQAGTYELLVWTGTGPEPALPDLTTAAAKPTPGAAAAALPDELNEIDSKVFVVG
jgi:hypothetical protein